MPIVIHLTHYTCRGSLDRMRHKRFRPSRYNGINSTKSPGSGTGNGSESRLTSQDGRVREILCSVDQCVSGFRVVEMSVLIWLRSRCKKCDWSRTTVRFVKTRTEGCRAKWQGLCGCNLAIRKNVLFLDQFSYALQKWQPCASLSNCTVLKDTRQTYNF